MTQLPPAIRKAAVLVSTLDDRAADALLQQMGDEMAARVRSALVELDDVPLEEQQAVLAEFFQGGQARPAAQPRTILAENDGVELEVSLHGLLEPSQQRAVAQSRGPFDFLREVPPGETARVLAREYAQTIAVVIAQLEADLAAQLLESLAPHLATEVLERLASLDVPVGDVLADIERQLRLELGRSQAAGQRTHSLAGLQALVGAMEFSARERVLAGLGKRNARLARQLGYDSAGETVTVARYRIESAGVARPAGRRDLLPVPLVDFDDLVALGDEALRRVFAAADPQVALLALTGASESLLARILSQLPAAEAATLRGRLNHPGAVRLSDIEAAQQQLAEVARRLAEEGVIALAGSRHFAAAA